MDNDDIAQDAATAQAKLADLRQKVERLEAIGHLLLANHLVREGYAATWKEAIAMARGDLDSIITMIAADQAARP